MRAVLSVASECAPLVKTGGLADVVGALPAALARQGWDMRVMLPAYPQVRAAVEPGPTVMEEDDLFGGPGRVVRATAAGLQLYLVDAPHLFEREGSIYLGADRRDWPDNPERFAALSWLAARLAREGDGEWRPELAHGHDWQAGLMPLYLARHVPTIMTVHNIAFHGLAPADRRHWLRLPEAGFNADGYEYWGQVSALKAGLVHADRLTTVSPTYAEELQTPEFGMGLDGLIRHRAGALQGILNGIDTEAWNPAMDPAIAGYDAPEGKVAARRDLMIEMGLEEGTGPIACVVSRLTSQKGLDLLLEALPALLERDGRLVLLGSGDAELEDAWRRMEEAHPTRVAVRIGYDEALSHRIIAGSDAILIPSRFEPCGLTQLYGLRYGTVPVVALTGGLADTVIDANPMALRSGVATGLQFRPITALKLTNTLCRLCDLFDRPELFREIQNNAMRQPVGWDASAADYAALYAEVTAAP
ncbi:glycogen synthase GlgA [Roseitranquillus sediminis]|uniref:glycogen synthase GlgA n=1 Tax=Roseitranquillus sediminis TaxID=2809051 RepID=UPI001D0C2439|nr:glycogen synthase GlgA [Roseitranquillus sediminis]MBM9596391.1 glycogen synthase GlgA [Roseitranquillus sediminis]